MRNALLAVLASVALLSPVPAGAWGKNGHETVGYIAASLIAGTNAEKQVKKLLKPGESMATAAEWPDCAKGFRYCHKDPTPEMKDFADPQSEAPQLPLHRRVVPAQRLYRGRDRRKPR